MTKANQNPIGNEITVIHPYKYSGMWVFDDARVGLEREPFVAGADTMIDQIVVDIPDAEQGFNMIFSRNQFPGSQFRLKWRRAEMGGNVYYSSDLEIEGWLCPALLRYFAEPPTEIYVEVRRMGASNVTTSLTGGTIEGSPQTNEEDEYAALLEELEFFRGRDTVLDGIVKDEGIPTAEHYMDWHVFINNLQRRPNEFEGVDPEIIYTLIKLNALTAAPCISDEGNAS